MFSCFEGSVIAWMGCGFRGEESSPILANWSMIGKPGVKHPIWESNLSMKIDCTDCEVVCYSHTSLSSMSLLETHQAENIVITGELRIINPSIISDDKQEHQEHLARQSTKHPKRQAI